MDGLHETSFKQLETGVSNLQDAVAAYFPSQTTGLDEDMKKLDIEASSPETNSLLTQWLRTIDTLQAAISESPYSIPLRLSLAEAYRQAGYPDLTAGEAYYALLLVDEVVDESGEFHEEALEAAQADIARESAGQRSKQALRHGEEYPDVAARLEGCEGSERESEVEVEEDEAAVWAGGFWGDAAYAYVAGSLLMCGCLKSASEICERGIKTNPENAGLLVIKDRLRAELEKYMKAQGWSLDDEDITIDDYPERGFVRRELYPWWKAQEPDRYSDESLALLNEQLSAVAPLLEARVTELPLLATDTTTPASGAQKTVKQLGVFAKEDILPHTQVLNETSLLTANARLHDAFCDACSATLPSLSSPASAALVHCPSCADVIFCSARCHDLAQSTYHPAICDTSVESIAKDAPAAHAADALYSLLLLRALAMAQTQSRHPLHLNEVQYIWGDYTATPRTLHATPTGPVDPFARAPRTLPFSFAANVLTPLHMLEKMDIDVFAASASGRFAPWVFNSLYARFRGTASARQGPDGRPEVGAVHPLWCLANHSCDPNVRWEWEGTMGFWVRGERVRWGGGEGGGVEDNGGEEVGREDKERKAPGLKKDDEVLSHYCDIDLPVGERREWAAGALGGMCMCERCVWEAARVPEKK